MSCLVVGDGLRKTRIDVPRLTQCPHIDGFLATVLDGIADGMERKSFVGEEDCVGSVESLDRAVRIYSGKSHDGQKMNSTQNHNCQRQHL